MVCGACGTGLLAGAKFCAECGTPALAACRSCGTELTPNLKFCPECGTPASAASAEVGLARAPLSERRVTSVLFGDLVGFTTLSESRDAEDVRELLGRYFDTAREIVARYGGTIEKFIGDAVMAVWGVPSAHEDDAERAVRAGLELTDAVAAFGESVGAPGLAMRVGVVTGEVAVTLGATDQGMVAGDAVNTAARVQAKAEPGSVWVDAQTRSLTGGAIDYMHVGVHDLKGKAEPVDLYAATAVMGGVGGGRSSDRVQAPLVGRRRELNLLKEMFHVAAEERRPRLIVLSGDAGVGKTRLGWEFQNYIDGLSATVLWHRGRCLAYGDGVAFSALNSAVRGRIGASEDDSDVTTRAKLAKSLETYVPEESERTRLSAALVNLLGLSGASVLTRPELFSAWLTWFERLSRSEDEAVIWVVDDAQYADDGLLDFIEHLSTVAQAPILIALLARPELLTRRPTLAALRRANLIGLETLSRADIAALFDVLVEGLPADVRDALVDRAEGNPLYAIETVRAMNDQSLTVGGPTRTPGAVRLATGVDATTLRALAAPASLQVLVASRLDLLPSAERSVLAAASVLGQTFTLGALEAITDSALDLASILRELIGRDLLTTVTDRLSSEEGHYAFVQAVVRTVAYQTQSRRDRLQCHLDVVGYLETMVETDNELSVVIAQHLRDAMTLLTADEPQYESVAHRLASWLERSAERSLAVGAPLAALRAFDEALRWADVTDQVRLHLAAADAATAAGDYEATIEHARPVAVSRTGTARSIARATSVAANALRLSGKREEGWELLKPYLADGAFDNLPASTGATLARQIANNLGYDGRFDESNAWCERGLRLAEDAADPREIVQCLTALGITFFLRGIPRMGEATLDLAADVARAHQLAFELGMPLLNMLAFRMNRNPDAALDAGAEAMVLFEQTGSSGQLWHVVINQAMIIGITGRWDQMATLSDRPLLRQLTPTRPQAAVLTFETALVALARGEEIDLQSLESFRADVEPNDESGVFYFYIANLAMLARATRDFEALPGCARRMVDLTFRLCSLDDDFPLLWSLAVGWMIDAEDYAGARELLSVVADVPAPRLNPQLSAQLPRLRGTIEASDPASSADPAAIERDLLDGIVALENFGALPDRARAQATLGLWLTRQGRGVEATSHLAAARATFTDLRATTWLQELDAALSLAAAG